MPRPKKKTTIDKELVRGVAEENWPKIKAILEKALDSDDEKIKQWAVNLLLNTSIGRPGTQQAPVSDEEKKSLLIDRLPRVGDDD